MYLQHASTHCLTTLVTCHHILIRIYLNTYFYIPCYFSSKYKLFESNIICIAQFNSFNSAQNVLKKVSFEPFGNLLLAQSPAFRLFIVHQCIHSESAIAIEDRLHEKRLECLP